MDRKTSFAVSKGLITEGTSEAINNLYKLRNNVHILKAAESNYSPKLKEAKEAFELMQLFVGEIKDYYNAHPVVEEIETISKLS